MYQMNLEKAEELEIKWLICISLEKHLPASSTILKPLCGSQQTEKFLEMGITDHLTYLLRNLYAGEEATVTTGHGTTDWFQIRTVKAVYCHPAYLTYVQSTS